MHITMRKARQNDCELIFDWVNEDDSLSNKLVTSTRISFQTHKAWFEKRVDSETVGIWIAELDSIPVGQVRCEATEDGLEIDIYVDRQYRNRGIGLIMLLMANDLAREKWSVQEIIARIKDANIASQKLFESAGYEKVGTGYDHFVYRFIIGR